MKWCVGLRGLAPKYKFRFNHPLYSIDVMTIEVCLSVFDGAKFRKQKGAIKMHCQLDRSGNIPVFAHISDGKMHDMKAAQEFFKITPDSIYLGTSTLNGSIPSIKQGLSS